MGNFQLYGSRGKRKIHRYEHGNRYLCGVETLSIDEPTSKAVTCKNCLRIINNESRNRKN